MALWWTGYCSNYLPPSLSLLGKSSLHRSIDVGLGNLIYYGSIVGGLDAKLNHVTFFGH